MAESTRLADIPCRELYDEMDREEYIQWLEENISEYECARCGAICNDDPVKTRFGPVDVGCALHWWKEGKIQQRTLSDFQVAV